MLRAHHEEANGQLTERCSEQIQQIDVLLSEVRGIPTRLIDCLLLQELIDDFVLRDL